LGDTILGLSAVALWGLTASSLAAPWAFDPGAHEPAWHHGVFPSLDERGSLLPPLPENSPSAEAGSPTLGDRAGAAPTAETTGGFPLSSLAGADALGKTP
jgi:hypothetical protein